MNNMFPHKITLIKVVNNELKCHKVEDVLYISDKIVSPEGNGEKYMSTHKCIFSNKAIQKIKGVNPSIFPIKTNDIIVKGIVDVKTSEELKKINEEYFRVKTISVSDYALIEELNNIEVTD